jgi:hypothetical protein
MKYTFKEMLNAEIYQNTRVMFVLGKYTLFNNMVADELKEMCIEDSEEFGTNTVPVVSSEFGLDDEALEGGTANSVDFNTFMDVIGVLSINGKWYCRVEYSSLTKKQLERLMAYIKDPSINGILVVSSTEWKDYRDLLKNRILSFSKVSHIMQLSFPSKDILKVLVGQLFSDKGVEIDNGAIDFFITRMSSAYESYEEVIDDIVTKHGQSYLDIKSIKNYMKGIENFIIDDFIRELVKPMVSDKTNSKKVLKIMMALEDEYGAKGLVYKLIPLIDEALEFRVLINSGSIPIGINYFYKDVINGLGGENSKYGKMSEWKFRSKAILASQTSLRDWEYMKLILNKAIENVKISDAEMDIKCQRALYDLCTRSVITADRVNNIIGIDDVLDKGLRYIDKVVFDEKTLQLINEEEQFLNKGEQ